MKFNRIIKPLIIIVFLFIITVPVYAQEILVEDNNVADTILLNNSNSNSDLNVENLESLNDKVVYLESINNKILNTIYWFIGSFATIFLIILGGNYLSNKSLNDKRIKEIEGNLDNKAKTIENNILSKLDELSEKKVNLKSKEVTSQIKGLNSQLMEIEIKFLKNKIDMGNNKLGLISIDYINLLNLEIVRGYEFGINEALERIQKHIIEKENNELYSDEIQEFKDVVSKVPDNVALKRIVLEILNKVKLSNNRFI